MGLPPCSAATGAYCKARAKLPEPFLRHLTYQVGREVEDPAPAAWRWHNRRTLLVDGSTCTMPDTPENQAAYPQQRGQSRGLGFPMIRLVVLLTFATATIVGCAFGPFKGKQTGETALFRQLFDQLRAGDVIVADRYYCSYSMIALLIQQGVDVVFRMHQIRYYDFRRGQRLGHDDHIVEWERPQRPTWMDPATYAATPETLSVRELRFNVDNPGFRTREIIVATTLLDDRAYSREDIAKLYEHCWQAAWERGLCPRQISFAGTVQMLEAFRVLLLATDQRMLICRQMFLAIATHEVGDRPGRVEPRCIKRRQGNQCPILRMPRSQAEYAIVGYSGVTPTRLAQSIIEEVERRNVFSPKTAQVRQVEGARRSGPVVGSPTRSHGPRFKATHLSDLKSQTLATFAERMEVPFSPDPFVFPYSELPGGLANIHKRLEEAVFAAYG